MNFSNILNIVSVRLNLYTYLKGQCAKIFDFFFMNQYRGIGEIGGLYLP
jgi:hypothetical protein